MTWQERIIAAHTEVAGNSVSHARRIKASRYFIWQEDGANDLCASDRHVERSLTGSTDFFTKMENDPWADALGESLSSHGIAWHLNSVQYEEDTGFFHYEWLWNL